MNRFPRYDPPRLPLEAHRSYCRPCPSCCAGFLIALAFGVGLGIALCLFAQWAIN